MGWLFNDILKDDLYRYEGDGNKNLWIRLKYLFGVPGYTYTFIFRHATLCHNRFIRLFWIILLYLTRFITHIQIPVGTKIGRGFRIAHFGHIVVNPNAEIGKNFNISQGCLIGNSLGRAEGVPTIGDNVCMNANSIIIGGVHIGNDVLIAPGAFVNFDVPDNSIVIGNPGKIIERDSSPTEKYIVYPVHDTALD